MSAHTPNGLGQEALEPPTALEPVRWGGAWVLLAVALSALVALNVFVLWLERWSGVDADALATAHPAMRDVFRYFGFEFVSNSVAFGAILVVCALALTRDRSNMFAWLFGGSVVLWMLSNASFGATALALDAEPALRSAPGLAWLGVATITLFPMGLNVAVALFPNGRLAATGPWRRVLIVALFVPIAIVSLRLLQPGPMSLDYNDPPFALDNPFGLGVFAGFGPAWSQFATAVSGVAVLASVATTYVRAGSDVRHQLKWVIGVIPYVSVSAVLISALNTPWAGLPVAVGMLLFATALGFAVTKYRLYDIDVVISRTFVYASLAVFIGVVYIGVVVGVGSLLGSTAEPNPVLAVAATSLVAVAFQPVRRRLERVANRLVFGRKATPYEVLSDFSRRVAATSDTLLTDAARSLAEGTRAERVVVSVIVDGETVEAAAWPVEPGDTPSGVVSFPIEDGDMTLGSLDVFLSVGQELRDDDRRLAEQLAAGMGLALRNQLLTERLEGRVEELRESRRRLVAVQDETRRRIERDLHDGAQQQLVALKVKLGLGRAIAEKNGATRTGELLDRLSGQADAAVDAMREFARGVYPPLLEAEGLPAAINAHARRSPIPVSVDSNGIGRYPREIESTVYFCVLEALRNTVQHGEASQATVTLTRSNGSLEFLVADDGIGFDRDAVRGVGLTGMADRLDALAGELVIHTEPGNGTTLTGVVPVPSDVTA